METQPLNILYLPSWYPSKEHHTKGIFVRRHAIATASKHQVFVLFATESSYDDIEIMEEANLVEVKVYFKKKVPVLSYRRAMERGYVEILKFSKSFDLAHVHVAHPAGFFATQVDIPYIITEHFSGYHKESAHRWGRVRGKLVRRIFNKAQLVLPVSNHLGSAIEYFGSKTEWQKTTNIVDADIFQYQSEKPEIFTFLHISTLEERSKNITGLLEGFKRLLDKGVAFKLKIGGDGDMEELKEKVLAAGLDFATVELIPEKPIEGIAHQMQQAHCFVMFSHFENQPCTILEALSTGLPIVSSNVGGIPEEINQQNGLLVDPNDIDALVEKLESTMSNYQNYNGESISKSAHALYSYKSYAEEITKVYLNVLKKAASHR